MSAKHAASRSWRIEILVAVIGFLGITTAAVINRWDVLFPPHVPQPEDRERPQSPATNVPRQPTPEAPSPHPAAAPPKILRFTASQTVVKPGEKITLSWAVRGAQLLRLLPGEQTVPGPDGSFDVTPDADVTYVLSATNQNGQTAEERVDVRVAGPPIDTSWRKAEAVRVAMESTRAMLTLDLAKYLGLIHEPFAFAGRELSGEALKRELQLVFDQVRAQLPAQRPEPIVSDVLTVAEYRSQLTGEPGTSIPKLDARLAALNLTSDDYVVVIGYRGMPPSSKDIRFVGFRGDRCKLLALE